MNVLISVEDVSNFLGINLAGELAQKDNNTTFLNNWLYERQEEIIDYIASFAYRGRRQAEEYLQYEFGRDKIKRACLAQISYTLDNAKQFDVGGVLLGQNGVSEVSMTARLSAGIAPRAHQILATSGFLYSGRA